MMLILRPGDLKLIDPPYTPRKRCVSMAWGDVLVATNMLFIASLRPAFAAVGESVARMDAAEIEVTITRKRFLMVLACMI